METALLKSLKLLRDTAQSLTERDIADRTKEEQIYVAKALKNLRERKVVVKNGEFYSYQKTQVNEKFSEGILAVYDKISKKSQVESLIIGLLSTATYYRHLLGRSTLLRVLGKEGFDSDQINIFLEQELKQGRIIKLKLAIETEKQNLPPVPPAIPRYNTSQLPQTNKDEYERLKKSWIDKGYSIQEEEYLIANFPPHMADSAREYLDKELPQIKQKVRDESIKWWYRLGVGWRYLR